MAYSENLELLVNQSDRERLFVTEAIESLNEIVADAHRVAFDAERYGQDVTIDTGDALVLLSQTNKLSFVDHTGAVTAGFSGWAIEESFKYRGGYDETFTLSGHSDFSELTVTVETFDPKIVYTQYGFSDEFATYLMRGWTSTRSRSRRTRSHSIHSNLRLSSL